MQHRVLKENDLFLLTEPDGNIPPKKESELGLYTKDTRFLSTYQFEIDGMELILLSSVADQNYVGHIRLTNKEVKEEEEVILWRESVGINRKRFLYEGVMYERIIFENHNTHPVSLQPTFCVDADFSDMFVVRGFLGGKRGSRKSLEVQQSGVRLPYMGSDHVFRQTEVSFQPEPQQIREDGVIVFQMTVAPESTAFIDIRITPLIQDQQINKYAFEDALQALENSYRKWNEVSTKVESDSVLFNQIYKRSLQDLRSLLTDLGEGQFPVAGIPWFAVPFGRDSIIAALQMLAVNPEIAKGTLRTLAKYQGRKVDPWRDEQPGKILHEIRFGELANNNDIPHTPYYGTIDATPLFLVLTAEYYRWTGDKEFIRSLLPNVQEGLRWINEYGDRDGDGYVEYFQESSKGIANQGWKDSADSVIHRDGSFAKAPIALSEVQGYVYDAKKKLADIFMELGEKELAEQLQSQARQLKEQFAEHFWMEEEQFIAIALDQEKKKVESVTSDPGHCLWSGLLTDEQAKKVVQRLVAPDMFTGYGVRTMSSSSTRYNPMSYHDGSIWPHDNSLVFLGMQQQGFGLEAMKVVQGLLNAAGHFEYYRLPELFCGYSVEDEPYPVDYPVACKPQAWAAGTAFLMVQAMLGIQPDVPRGSVQFSPSLPPSINRLRVNDIRLGQGSMDVLLTKDHEDHVTIQIMRNSTGLTVELK